MSRRRPRRRARRRSPARPIILLLAAAVVLAILIGGLSQVSRQSQGYDAASDRALAAQGSIVAEQSNATAAQVRKLVNDVATETRQGLQLGLDTAVAQSATQSAQATLAVRSMPLGPVATNFEAVFAERAQSMTELRAAVDGYLEMGPIPDVGAPAATTTTTGATSALSAAQATNRIAAAGALLVRADHLYGTVRQSLASGNGHGRLPRSVWVTNPQLWQVGTVAAQVDLLATSPSLLATHDVVIRTTRLVPPALPSAQGAPAGTSVLSPTRAVGVTVVLANQGSVVEPHVSVRFTMADQTSGASATRAERTALALDASVTLPTATFSVKPGASYVLSVQIVLPPGQTETNGTLFQQALQVAPAT